MKTGENKIKKKIIRKEEKEKKRKLFMYIPEGIEFTAFLMIVH